jgi:hypothetical protein
LIDEVSVQGVVMSTAGIGASKWDAISEPFFRLDDRRLELNLFCTRNALDKELLKKSWLARHRDGFYKTIFLRWGIDEDCWAKRLNEWEEHVNRYFEIYKNGENPLPTHLGTKRLEKLSSSLGVLDNKFSMLLSVNGTMLAAVGLMLASVPKLIDYVHYSKPTEWLIRISLEGIFALIIICNMFNIWHGLLGFRRIVWGDLTGFESAEKAEQRNVQYMIVSVARRTNLFRVISFVTRCAFRLFTIFIAGTLLVLLALFAKDVGSDFRASSSPQASSASSRTVPISRLPIVPVTPPEMPPVSATTATGTGQKGPVVISPTKSTKHKISKLKCCRCRYSR